MKSRAVFVGLVILPLTVAARLCGRRAAASGCARPDAGRADAAGRRGSAVLGRCLRTATRVDEYYWLRDDTRTDKAVLGYLEAENAYTAAMTAHTRALADRVYEETVARIQQDDSTVPYRKRGYWYYTRYEAGSEHPIYARKAGTLEAPEQVMLDANELGRGHGYYAVGEYAIAPDDRLLAYVDDTVGRRQYTLRFKDLATGKTLPDAIPNVEPDLAWNADSTSVLYVEKNPVTLLGYRVRRHVLGTDPARDPLVYEQDDLSFYTSVTHHQGRPLPPDRGREHRGQRSPLRRRGGPGAHVSRLPAARARPRVLGRAPRTVAGSFAATGRRPISACSRRRSGTRAIARVGASWWRIARMPSSTASTCSATSSPSPSAPGRCARSGSGPGTAARTSTSSATSRPTRPTSGENPEIDTRVVRYEYTSLTQRRTRPMTTTSARARGRC